MPHDAASPRYLMLCGLLLLVSAAPFLFGTHPPLTDYPFYIARVFILSELGANPFVAEHYAATSFLIPNVGAELVLLPLAALLPYEIAFDVFFMLVFVLLLMGTIFLHRTLFDEFSLWPLISGAFLINWILLFGFLSYILGVGLFLWAFAVWIRLSRRERPFRLLFGALVATALFFVHLAAFGLYAVAVLGFEVQRGLALASARDRAAVMTAIRAPLYAALQFLPPLALWLFSPTRAAGLVDRGVGGVEYDLVQKVFAPIVTLTSGDLWLDVVTGSVGLVVGTLILLFGRVALAPSMIGPLAALMLAYVALPHHLGQAQFVDSRLPVAILFVMIASLRIAFERAFAGVLATVLVAGLIVVKSGVLAWDWRRHDELIGEYMAAFERLPAQSTLFVAAQQTPRSWARRHYAWRMRSPTHVADLATLTGSIFAPSVFAFPGQHTIAVREAFAELKRHQGPDPIEVGDRQDLAAVVEEMAALHREVGPGRAAYLLLLDRAQPELPVPQDARLVESGPGFRLLEIALPGMEGSAVRN